jgi:hypothetical protein
VSLLLLSLALSDAALAAPVLAPIELAGANDTSCVAAAPFAGWYAFGDSFQDRVEVRDIRANTRRVVALSQIQAVVPWVSLDGGPDGVGSLAFSASGRLLFIAVHDDTVPADGQPSDAILRLDVSTGALSLFARLDIASRGDVFPHLSMAHTRGYLLVGTSDGQVRVFSAGASQLTGSPVATWTLPAGGVRGLAIDRDGDRLFLATQNAVYRCAIPSPITAAPSFTQIVPTSAGLVDIRALAFGDHFGAPSQRGLYILSGDGDGSRIDVLTAASAFSSGGTPTLYTSNAATWHDLAFAPDGSMLIGADEDALRLADSSDLRLPFDNWLTDEFAQVLAFSRGLISPEGEPAGWVIDADVIPAWSRFHPATPDAAAWAILMLVMSDELNSDPLAQSQVRTILTRYAGLASDNIRPIRNTDGIYKHWLDPFTGNTKATWADEYATMSTMKIVAAAARALAHFPDDPVIARAASIIIFKTKNYDAYFQSGTDAMALTGVSTSGPNTSSWSRPFQEGILFAEQAGVYGGTFAKNASTRWFNRPLWPTGTFISGRPITTANSGQFDAAFLSLYPALLSKPYRADTAWRTQVDNVRWSNAAWTDDNLARYSTVFSAGTSPNGYNADSLATNNHPGNVTTFTSLMGFSAFGETADALGAYAAYRKGARQTFKSGASILYRRPVDAASTFEPNSAGMPDVALGALGLTELIKPGSLDNVLAIDYPTLDMCPLDLNADGLINEEDIYVWLATPVDLNADGVANANDIRCLRNWVRRHEATDMGRP